MIAVPAAYIVLSLITFFVFGWDKRQARKQKRRIPESTLHIMELVGGWPGSLLGQRVFHHKTRKRSYQVVFWLIVVLHAGFWCWWFIAR